MIAAANPASVPYLYYVTKPDACGALAFATTYAQFQADAAAYNAARNARGRPLADDVPVSPRAGRSGVLGWPVAHSRSPVMHGAALRGARPARLELPAPAGAARAVRRDGACAARGRASSAPT